MTEQKINRFTINEKECKNIQNRIRKEFLINVKNIGLYILLGASILAIVYIAVGYFLTAEALSPEKTITICSSIAGIISPILFIIFISLSIKEHQQKIFEQISTLILRQIPDLKIKSKSIDMYEDFFDEGYDGEWYSKIKAANICLPFCKSLDDNFLLYNIFRKNKEAGSYLKFKHKNKLVQIFNAKFEIGLSKLPCITLFRGIIIFIDKNKLFNGNYCILSKNKLGLKRKPFANIPLLNIEHHLLKNYSVYSDRNTDLNKIINPEFLNSFLALKNVFKASIIDFGTNGGTTAILINTKRTHFGLLPLFKPLNQKTLIELCEQYNAIFKFIMSIE